MKTHELLAANEETLAPRLKQMKLKELERHAEKIISKYGQASYKTVLGTVIKGVASLDVENDRFLDVQNMIRGHISETGEGVNNKDNNGVVERLAVLLMVIITKKFQEIHARAN